MAKNVGNLLSLSNNFFARLIFGLVLTLVFVSAGNPPTLSIFLGVMGGLALGWMTSASKSSGKAETVGTSDGIDAGLKYWLFFLLGFIFLGYPSQLSILFGALGGIAGGWIVAWWRAKEQTQTQIQFTEADPADAIEGDGNTNNKRYRRDTRRFRRRSGPLNINFRFWQR